MNPLPPAEPAAPGEKSARALALLAALVLVAFGPTLTFGWTGLDDQAFIVDRAGFLQEGNPLDVFRQGYTDGRQGEEFYYRPLVVLSFLLDARLGGLAPAAFHLTNVALQLLAAWLLFGLLRRLLRRERLALGLAAVFAVHPAATASVAWVPGRNDLLATVFVLGALLLFARYRERRGAAALAGHGLLLLLALLTKEIGAVVPVLAAAQAWLVEPAAPRAVIDRRLAAAWALAFGVWFALRSAVEVQAPPLLLGERLGDAVTHLPTLAHALGKLVFPVELAVLAHAPDTSWAPALLAVAAVAVAAAGLPAGSRRLAAFGAVVFLVPLGLTLPVSDALILENRLYLPLVGLLIFAGARLRELPSPRFARAAAAALVALLALRTLTYAPSYRDPIAFAEDCVANSPGSALAQLTAGNAFLAAGDLERAERAFVAGLAADPRERILHNNLGVVHLRRGELEEAERALRGEIALNPGYEPAFLNLGLVLRRLGRPAEAIEAFGRALEIAPGYPEALAALRELEEAGPRR